jgi:Ca2+-binding EF-hand superfamily protein
MASSNNTYDAQASTNYKEAFALFDKRGTQRVSLDSLGDLLRACGQNPTLAEIRELEKSVGGDCMSSCLSFLTLAARFRAEAGHSTVFNNRPLSLSNLEMLKVIIS